jgi:hypothetical protein
VDNENIEWDYLAQDSINFNWILENQYDFMAQDNVSLEWIMKK